MLRLTIGQLADQLKVEYAVASSLVKLIIASGKGREVGKVDMQGKKGKPSSIYELPEVFTLNLKNGESMAIQDASNPLNAAA